MRDKKISVTDMSRDRANESCKSLETDVSGRTRMSVVWT